MLIMAPSLAQKPLLSAPTAWTPTSALVLGMYTQYEILSRHYSQARQAYQAITIKRRQKKIEVRLMVLTGAQHHHTHYKSPFRTVDLSSDAAQPISVHLCKLLAVVKFQFSLFRPLLALAIGIALLIAILVLAAMSLRDAHRYFVGRVRRTAGSCRHSCQCENCRGLHEDESETDEKCSWHFTGNGATHNAHLNWLSAELGKGCAAVGAGNADFGLVSQLPYGTRAHEIGGPLGCRKSMDAY